jgi:hypothetical protein
VRVTAFCAALLLGASVGQARAAEVTRVVSGFEEGKRFDVAVSLTWTHDWKRASIKRESESAAGLALVPDLIYHQARDVLNARFEIGVLRDVGLHVDLPYVLRDDRSLDFDQGAGSACVFPGAAANPTCVNEQSSTLLRDGILPGAGQASYGVDAIRGRPFSRPSSRVFQGPQRAGLESLGFGLSWAVMNQLRDDTKPTWTLGIDAKLDVGSDMRYDAGDPGGNTSVGLGYHQLVASTFVSKRVGSFDPYFGAYYMLPIPDGGSPFDKTGVGSQPHAAPQNRTGVQIGFELVAWERPEASQRVTLEVRTRADHRFQGSSHSELWEPLSGAAACGTAGRPACRAGLDEDLNGDGIPDAYPGVTETQAYSSLGGDVGFNVQAGKYVRFRSLFGVTGDLSHFITYGSAGSDTNGDGRVDSDNVNEANPVYRELIDIPGRRFKVEGSTIWSLLIEGALMF